jgi:ligand-binding sensor domain-containing protein
VLLAVPVAAQEPSWRSFSTADGLPANRSWALAQDVDGTLWVGTDGGLRYFFDRRFHLEHAMPNNVSQARINALLVTPDGSLWVASSAGLYRRRSDGRWEQSLEQQAGLDTTEISALLLDHEGMVWVGARDGLARWDGNTWETIAIDDTAPSVSALAEDAEGRLWVVEPIWIHVLLDGELVKTISEEDGLPLGAELKALLRDRRGDMWLATAGGLVQLSHLSVRRTFTEEDGLSSRVIWALVESREGGLWVGMEFGLAHLVDGTVEKLLTSADGLADDRTRALFRDGEGNLWVSTDDGLTRLPLGQWVVETDPLLRRVSISTLLADEQDGDYVGISGGVALRTPDGRWSLLADGSPGRMIYALTRDVYGQLWIGGDGGLARLDGERFVPDARLPLTRTVTTLLADREGLWVGTHDGLHRMIDGTQMFYGKASGELGQDSVLALWNTRAGDLWVGTLGGGASRFRQGEWLLVSAQSTAGGLRDGVVLAGLEDSAGNLWFGTSRGLSRLQADADPADRSAWRSFLEPEIVGNRVNALWEDTLRPGLIWVGTERGLNLIVGDEVSTFTRQDGLSHKWINALGQDMDGTLWIGTALGLTYHRDAGQAPQIALGELLVDNEVCDAVCQAEGVTYRSRTALFSYRSSDLGDLDGLRYRYCLRRSTDSTRVQESHHLTSTAALAVNLTPDTTYTFTVTALDRDFNESSATEPLVLRVKAPTPWDWLRDHPFVLVGLAVVLTGSGMSALQWYRRRGWYHYHDVHITVVPTEEPERARADLETHRIRRVQRHGLLNRLVRRLPGLGWSRWPSLRAENVPIDLTRIREIQEPVARLGDDRINEVRLQFIGQALYQMLLTEKPIAEQLERAGLGRQRLRLRLSFDGPLRLACLPWELLHGGNKIGFLGQRADTALVRFVEPIEGFRPPTVNKELRVLVVMAQPDDERVGELGLVEEKARLDEVLAGIAQVDYLFGVHAATEVGVEAEARHLPEQLLKRLRDGWDVVHFVGHAGPDLDAVGEAEIVLWCEDRRGDYMALSAEDLGRALKGLAGDGKVPKLVVLSACETASMGSELVRSILDSGVAAVVGMQWPVLDIAGPPFTDGFYSTLVRHGQVDHAVGVARNQMANKIGLGRRDWAAPVLVMQTADGVIFEKT